MVEMYNWRLWSIDGEFAALSRPGISRFKQFKLQKIPSGESKGESKWFGMGSQGWKKEKDVAKDAFCWVQF